ncbi:hypothetical protein [Saccharopolyspora griseoalba]|uniref:Uncharacterized protein n=1 Tax=Saccharopolyspora griseoalba TaxID=1431848 RepID=A0ABW2LTK0_9PSEU
MSGEGARTGVATVEPFENVFFEPEREAAGLPPWRNEAGNRFYLTEEIETAPRGA